MFYFLLAPIMMYNGILIAAAVIPAVVLMVKVYKLDRLEKESTVLLRNLVVAGILSSLLALVEERVLSIILNGFVSADSYLYNIILYFGIVAICEESSKYYFLKKRTWNNPEFNCLYDGVVYAVFVSLGFALWENISYVMMYGFSTAIVRAVTAIPGHACFGVFMGVFYSFAKSADNAGYHTEAASYRLLSVIVSVLLHGAYDYIASMENAGSGWYFLIFIAVLFVVAFYLLGKISKEDRFI
ncbi:MAG: PrsW family intramembrane metalloprotease [Eubacterium sp.]|nr:PrsW family intramembrane metalloprotease [Eubacterium sp.]